LCDDVRKKRFGRQTRFFSRIILNRTNSQHGDVQLQYIKYIELHQSCNLLKLQSDFRDRDIKESQQRLDRNSLLVFIFHH
jgi:hypothetical protein